MAAKINEFKNRFDSPIGVANLKMPNNKANKKASKNAVAKKKAK